MEAKIKEDLVSGYNAYRTSDKSVKLTVVQIQNDQESRGLLMRVKNIEIRKSDWGKLKTRNPQFIQKPEDYDYNIR